MDHLFALGPSVLVPLLTATWLAAAAAAALAVGRAIRVADRRSAGPAER
ncbi:MAG TPA: hypothetical protein VGO26_06415 [Amnibacterium sp.]|jgi:hypothetical protein|nr:hypothetical protein [Amnibacterium sp.]